MRLTADNVIDAMGSISQQFITEAAVGSQAIRERLVLRISTAVASLALVAVAGIFTVMYAGGGKTVIPGDTSPWTETEIETETEAETETETDDMTPTEIQTATVVVDGVEVTIEWYKNDLGYYHVSVESGEADVEVIEQDFFDVFIRVGDDCVARFDARTGKVVSVLPSDFPQVISDYFSYINNEEYEKIPDLYFSWGKDAVRENVVENHVGHCYDIKHADITSAELYALYDLDKFRGNYDQLSIYDLNDTYEDWDLLSHMELWRVVIDVDLNYEYVDPDDSYRYYEGENTVRVLVAYHIDGGAELISVIRERPLHQT